MNNPITNEKVSRALPTVFQNKHYKTPKDKIIVLNKTYENNLKSYYKLTSDKKLRYLVAVSIELIKCYRKVENDKTEEKNKKNS